MYKPGSGTPSPLTTTGDLWGYGGGSDNRLPVGSDGLFLKADSSVTLGLSYASPAGAALSATIITSAATFSPALDVIFVNASSTTFAITLPNPASFPIKPIKIIRTDVGGTFSVSIGGRTIAGATNWNLWHNSESYELFTDGSAWQLSEHRAQTAWASFGCSLCAGFGVIAGSNFVWRRIGDQMEINGGWQNGTVNASLTLIAIPFGQALDNTKFNSNGLNTFGNVYTLASNSVIASSNQGIAFYDGTDTANIYLATSVASGGSIPAKVAVSTWASTNGHHIINYIKFPVSGWNP